jgi:hypothetical protein
MSRTLACCLTLSLVLTLAASTPAQGGAVSDGTFAGGVWTDVGSGLPGTGGVTPLLEGLGPLTAGSANALVLSNALPNSTAHLVVGFGTRVFLPFKGGTLVPAADAIIFGLPVSSTGTLQIPFHFPPGIAPSTLFWVQHWIVDAGGPVGFSASNGLQGEAQ